MFGNHGLGGLLEEGAHEKSPKCLGGNLGDFGEFCKGLPRLFCRFGYEYRQLCRCHGGCGRSLAGCGRRESNGAFFEKDMKHLLQNRIKQGRLKQVSDGLM